MSSKKSFIINILKLVLVVGLLFGLVRSGKLQFSQLLVVFSRGDAIIASIAVWVVGPVLLGTLRWWLLIKGAELECKYFRAMQLQIIGFFFNTAMPGAVGGDIVKAIYIVRDQSGPTGKTPAMLSVLLDRIVGLIGLFLMGVISVSFSFQQLAQNDITLRLMYGLGIVVVLSAVFLGFIFVNYKDGRDPVEKLLSLKIPGLALFKGIYSSLRSYKDQPKIIFSAIGISVLIQVIFLAFMGFIGRTLYGVAAFDSNLLAPIYPFGILVTAIPLAPGGMGVGHAAFAELFALVGLPGGGNVFNVYMLSQLALNLIGLIPYLSLKKQLPQSELNKVQVA